MTKHRWTLIAILLVAFLVTAAFVWQLAAAPDMAAQAGRDLVDTLRDR